LRLIGSPEIGLPIFGEPNVGTFFCFANFLLKKFKI